MTREEALRWAAGASWYFESHYKYCFVFGAKVSGRFTLTASVGGDARDIYKFHVQDPMTWAEICSAGEPDLTMTDLDGRAIYEG